MNKDKFNHFVKNPSFIDGESSTWINEFVQKFPFCSSLQAIYAKALNNKNDVNYTKQLRIAACYVGSREKLFELIQQQPEPTKKEYHKPTITIVKKQVVNNNDNSGTGLEGKIDFEEINSKQAEKPINQESSKSEINSNSSNEIVNPENNSLAESQSQTQAATDDLIDKNEISVSQKTSTKNKDIDSSKDKITGDEIKEDQDNNKTLPDPELEQLNKQILSSAISSSILLEASELQDLSNDKEDIKGPVITEKNKLSFIDWLNYQPKKNIVENPIEKEEVKKDNLENEKGAEKKIVRDNSELIDKFIRNNPEIVPKKTEFFSATNSAQKSLVDTNEIVSETLAKIYSHQGNYDKAIEAYRLLGLKYPEKSTYFELQIRLTEELKNKNK